MRTTSAVLSLVLVISVVATVPAQVATEEPQAATATQAQTESQDEQKMIVVTIQDIELTDEEEARIAAIRKEYRAKIEEDAKQLKDLAKEELDKIRDVFTPEQWQQVQKFIAEREEFKVESLAHALANLKALDLTEEELMKIAEIRKEFRPKIEESLKQLDGLLTDAQKKARAEAIKAEKPRREVLQALNLTSEQRAKLETIAKDLKNLVGNEAAKIRDVLTAEQKQRVQDATAQRRAMVRQHLAQQIANIRELNLTDEQRATLMQIRQEYGPKLHELGSDLRTAIGEEVTKIVEIIKPAGIVAERPERVQ